MFRQIFRIVCIFWNSFAATLGPWHCKGCCTALGMGWVPCLRGDIALALLRFFAIRVLGRVGSGGQSHRAGARIAGSRQPTPCHPTHCGQELTSPAALSGIRVIADIGACVGWLAWVAIAVFSNFDLQGWMSRLHGAAARPSLRAGR